MDVIYELGLERYVLLSLRHQTLIIDTNQVKNALEK
uniref:ABC transporter family protein n=1 Tax=Rhizophora mucronata TaxID=61149 RepID=A0A2P2KVN0_RHIMU